MKMSNEYKYELIIYWSEENGSYIVEIPELPGCMADGTTYENTVKNVQQIIKEWIEVATKEGKMIPKPKGRLIFA